jgi:hypothetical protein
MFGDMGSNGDPGSAKAPQDRAAAGELVELLAGKEPVGSREGLGPHHERSPLPASRLRFAVAFLGGPC